MNDIAVAAGELASSPTIAVPAPSNIPPTVAQAPMSTVNPSYQPSNVPLAPLPEQSAPQWAPSSVMPEVQTMPVAYPTIPASQFPSTNVPIAATNPVRMENSTLPAMHTPSTGVPLAPFPSDTSAQAQKGGANSFVIFNITVYTILSILIAGLF